MTQLSETGRVELQVLMANVLRCYHYLQICDVVLASHPGSNEGTRQALKRTAVAAGMLERGSGDLLKAVTGTDPRCVAS